MSKRTFAALALLCALMAAALPAAAGDISIDVAIAVQYSYGYFFGYVYAHGTEPLVDAHLLVNGVPLVPDKVNAQVFGNYGVWTLISSANVVKPGDVVSVVVTDISGGTARKDLVCGTVTSKKKSSDVTALCQ